MIQLRVNEREKYYLLIERPVPCIASANVRCHARPSIVNGGTGTVQRTKWGTSSSQAERMHRITGRIAVSFV